MYKTNYSIIVNLLARPKRCRLFVDSHLFLFIGTTYAHKTKFKRIAYDNQPIKYYHYNHVMNITKNKEERSDKKEQNNMYN